MKRNQRNPLNGLLLVVTLSAVVALAYVVHQDKIQGRRLQEPFSRSPSSMQIGNAALRHGDLKSAETAFRTALATKPSSASIRLALAQTYERMGRRSDALEQYATLVESAASAKQFPLGGADTLAHYGDLALVLGQEEVARKAFRVACAPLKLSSSVNGAGSGMPIPDGLRGEALATEIRRQMTLYEAHVQTEARLGQISADSSASNHTLQSAAHLAAALMPSLRKEAAKAHFRMALRANARDWRVQFEFAGFEARSGRTNEALALLRQAQYLVPAEDRATFVRWAKAIEPNGGLLL